MKEFIPIILIILSVSLISKAQDNDIENAMVEKEFLIIQSTKSYEAALKTAKEASNTLNIKLDLRGLHPDKTIGLSFSKEECVDSNGFDYPCYVARGRYDDGVYASIEYSSSYNGFKDGYYIVIIASGEKNTPEHTGLLKKAQEIYTDAYIKSAKVYMGCIH